MSVIFVRGGAGTGKTTLLSSFIHEAGLKNVCWVSLDVANANVYSFWSYFTAALSPFWEDGDKFLELIRSNPDASRMESLLIMMINRLCGEEDYYMVLDDVHCISDAALIRTFEFFIGAMPSNFHFFMLSREEPPVYLGSLAVSGRLLFIDGDQMKLTPAEGMEFMKNTLHLAGSEEELARLNTYAEGWIGGLQLAAAAGAGASVRLLQAGGGIAAEYLTREVFKSLTPPEKEFLIKTGFLFYFDAGICAALLDKFGRNDYTQIIEALINRNLFVICMDEKNGVYRYHNILSDYLMQQFMQLPEEQQKELHSKAAGAFEKRGDSEEALREFCVAENYDDVLRIARAMGGKIEAWNYLDRVPAERLIEDADLATQCFMYNFGNLNIERCRVLYMKFKERYGDSDVFSIAQFAESYLLNDDNILPTYKVMTSEQLDRLPFGTVAKAMIQVENSVALVEMMKYEEAEACINKAVQTCAGTNAFVEFIAYNQLAQVYEETGRLNDSLACYARSRELFRYPSMMSGIGTNYYFGLAGVYMRRMELEQAANALEQARLTLEKHQIQAAITDMTLFFHQIEMKFLTGDDEAGVTGMEEILSRYASFSVLTMGRLLHELDCTGRLTCRLADTFLAEIKTAESYRFQPFMRLLRARLLFKKGGAEEAISETDEILAFSRMHKNKLRLVEAGLLKVYILLHTETTGEHRREIISLLREAVYYAAEDRIMMPFYLDRTVLLPVMIELAAQATGKNAMSPAETAFLHDAMTICGYTDAVPRDKELLSARELEVLEQMSLGITNREIADKLCISQATVKTHVLSIFGKLGVSSRLLAVQEGQSRGLL
jgi:LuxR family maltose regulon positive regulatory protein